MALSGTTNKQSFTATASQTDFVFSIPFFNATRASDSGTTLKFGDIKVTRQAASDGTLTNLTPADSPSTVNQFKVTATNGDPGQGATITIGSGATVNDIYVVERDVAYTQEYDLQEGATIDPTALNKAFDRVVAQNQQQNDEFIRSITFPVTDADTITYNVDTSATDRAGKILGFDSNGSVTELAQIQGSASVDTSRGLQLVNNQVGVKDDGITNSLIANDAVDTAQIANDAVEQAQIADNAVGTAQVADSAITLAKMQDINNLRVLGNTSGSDTAPQQVVVNNETNMVSDSPTALATQQSIKAYVDLRQPKFVAINGTSGSTSLTFTADVRSSFGNETTWNLSDFTSTGAGNTPTLDINKCTEIHINISIFVYLGKTGFSAEYPDGTYREIAIDEAASSGDDNRMDFVARVPINPSLGQTIFKMKCLRSSSDSRDAGTAVITGATQF